MANAAKMPKLNLRICQFAFSAAQAIAASWALATSRKQLQTSETNSSKSPISNILCYLSNILRRYLDHKTYQQKMRPKTQFKIIFHLEQLMMSVTYRGMMPTLKLRATRCVDNLESATNLVRDKPKRKPVLAPAEADCNN